ncbi:hypothetical protein QA584_03505 [Anaerocolumna sp. AGMB13025]|uniref:hypothetical protein n=1 Tax=Anaerocolumna sp. AGMB13025 TaxID=3039116 RepID=UPI00241FB791|nr:hypothetical protein [Anaerocolumna sp. AGMB13025]WFR58142.1 hypothetical protein QA584_03505 [Anaerocolumna sp. AGMB13025]
MVYGNGISFETWTEGYVRDIGFIYAKSQWYKVGREKRYYTGLSEEYVRSRNTKKKKNINIYNVPYQLQAPFMELVRGEVWKKSESSLVAKINQEKRLMYYFSALNGMNTTIIIQKDWKVIL